MFTKDVFLDYFKNKVYKKSNGKPDKRLEALREHTIRLIEIFKDYDSELYSLCRLYWEHIILLSKDKLRFENLIKINQDYLKFIYDYDLPEEEDETLLDTINRHSYGLDPILSPISGGDDLIDIVTGTQSVAEFENPGIEITDEEIENLSRPLQSNLFYEYYNGEDWFKV